MTDIGFRARDSVRRLGINRKAATSNTERRLSFRLSSRRFGRAALTLFSENYVFASKFLSITNVIGN